MKNNLKKLLGLCLTVCMLCSGAAGFLPGSAAAEEGAADGFLIPGGQNFNQTLERTLGHSDSLTDSNAIDSLFSELYNVQIAPSNFNTTDSNSTVYYSTENFNLSTLNDTSGFLTTDTETGLIKLNTYPANQTIAGMTGSVPALKLGPNEAVISLTVDNFWIVDRKPATEAEKKNQTQVVLGKNSGTTLSVNGQEVVSNPDIAAIKALIQKARNSVETAKNLLQKLQEEQHKADLQALITQAEGFLSQAETADDKTLLSYVQTRGFDTLNGLAEAPASSARAFYAAENGTLNADVLGATLGIKSDDLVTFAARSGFTPEDLIEFFKSKNITLQDFADMMKIISDSGYSIGDFIEAGVLDNDGVGGLVVRLEDSSEGIQVKYTSPSGTTYQFCGAVVLSNGKQLQFGSCTNKKDTSQQFGEQTMDDAGTKCFFSTVYNETLGLYPGEMLMNRFMVIQDEARNPYVYWFDETGAQTLIGPLASVDPDGIIAQAFKDAGLENGLPRTKNANNTPENFEYLAHNLTFTVQQPSTCMRMGIELIQCKICGLQMAKDLPKSSHTLYKTERKEPSCTEEGYDEYWTCAVCHKRFSNIWGAEIQAPTPISALGHDLEHHEGQAPTCTEPGWDEYDTCKREGCDYTTFKEIPALGHDLTNHEAQAPTCTVGGWDTYQTCSRCDYSTYIAIAPDPQAHALVHHEAKAPTCTEAGWEAYDTCSRCDYSTYQEIAPDPQAHDLEHHEGKAPTCTEAGWEAYDTCSRCGYSTYQEIALLGHDLEHHDAKPATCTEAGCAAYDTCRREGCDYSTYSEIAPAPLGHDLVHHKGKAATCTEPGWEEYDTCKREGCDYTTYQEIAPDPQAHDLVHHDAKDPTCTEPGWDAYDTCSRCEYSTYQEKAPLGHSTKNVYTEETPDGYVYEIRCTRCEEVIGKGITTFEEMEEIGMENVEWDYSSLTPGS